MPQKPHAKKSPAKPAKPAAKPAEAPVAAPDPVAPEEQIVNTPAAEVVNPNEDVVKAAGEEALPNAEAEDAPKEDPSESNAEEKDAPKEEEEEEDVVEPEAPGPVLVSNDAWAEVQPTTPGFRKFQDPAGWWEAEVREDGFARVTKLGTIDRFNRHGGIKRMDTDVTIEGDVLSIIERLAELLVLTDAGD